MAKVTSKLQVTVPKSIAQQFGIRPGDEIDWIPAGDAIRVTPAARRSLSDDPDARLRLFDKATERHRRRPFSDKGRQIASRGWTREDLYQRGRAH